MEIVLELVPGHTAEASPGALRSVSAASRPLQIRHLGVEEEDVVGAVLGLSRLHQGDGDYLVRGKMTTPSGMRISCWATRRSCRTCPFVPHTAGAVSRRR
jgi:hypothetical protein